MRMAYVVMQVPPGKMSAFTPTMVHGGMAVTGGLQHRYGAPGTDLVEVSSPELPVMSFDPRTSGSNNAPDEIAPDLYVAGTANMGPFAAESAGHVGLREELPVPALAYGYVAGSAIPAGRRAKIGGVSTVPNPRVVPQWPARRHRPAATGWCRWSCSCSWAGRRPGAGR